MGRERLSAIAAQMRRDILKMAYQAGNQGAHIAPSLSIVDIMAVLYGTVMRYDFKNPKWEDRDRFLLSKGHGAMAWYTALKEVGAISEEELFQFEENDGPFPGQPAMNLEYGIEISSGSLGHGLGLGIGIALAGRKRGNPYRTFVLMGDGECNEGTVWESALAAAQFRLGHLIAVIDRNHMQSDGDCDGIMDMERLESKWESFGWNVKRVCGHDLEALTQTFQAIDGTSERPTAVIAETVKGKGISFMEHQREWHHRRLTEEEYNLAISELEASYVQQ